LLSQWRVSGNDMNIINDGTYGSPSDLVVKIAEPPSGPIYLEGYAIKRYEQAFKLLTEKIEALEAERIKDRNSALIFSTEINERIDRLVLRIFDLQDTVNQIVKKQLGIREEED
jgi:hypothetical protein